MGERDEGMKERWQGWMEGDQGEGERKDAIEGE